MIDLENLKPHERVILNSAIVSCITMFSIFASSAPNWNILWAGAMSAGLTFFTQLKTITSEQDCNKPKLLNLF